VILRKKHIQQLGPGWLPFADAASEGLPLGQLLRLGLFQVSVGMATVLLLGTLNRVMIVELSVPAMIVALMIALPVLSAPFRALLGFRSDTHRSAIGWKRIPYLWFGSLWQMGGFAIMPFALILLGGDQVLGPTWAGELLAALAFVMAGLGLHMTQTAGLALASDRATDETRPRVVALLYVMFLLGMAVSAVIVGALLQDYSDIRLIRVVQGCALATLVLNLIALWKQEKVRPMSAAERAAPRPRFAFGALRWPDPWPVGFGDHDADRGLRRWGAGGLWAGGALAGPGDRPLPDGRARHSDWHRRVYRRDPGRAVEFGHRVFCRRVLHWPWGRPFLGGHTHRGYGDAHGHTRRARFGTGGLGRSAGDGGGSLHRLWRCLARWHLDLGIGWASGRSLRHAGYRLYLCLPYGNWASVCHVNPAWPACPHTTSD